MQVEKLKKILEGPLPGDEAQAKMSPSARHTGNRISDPAQARPSSVLVLFYRKQGQWFLPFIQRPVYDGVHSGQVSFPGGKCEADDPSMLFTALRETHEEIGVDPGQVRFIGALTPLYIPNSNFFVYPQVGWMDTTPVFDPDPTEVDEVIEVPVSSLLDEKNIKTFTRTINGITIKAPFYHLNGYEIWGATAMMLSEMVDILKMTE